MHRSNTEKLSSVIKQALEQNEKINTKLSEVNIAQSWVEIMGKSIALYTQEIYIQNKVLFLKLSSPILKNELLLMQEKIINHINGYAKQIIINKVIIK